VIIEGKFVGFVWRSFFQLGIEVGLMGELLLVLWEVELSVGV